MLSRTLLSSRFQVTRSTLTPVSIIARHASSKPNPDPLLGNYPEVPFEYYQHRNPYKKYDDQQLRRNFNEPLHQNYDYIDLWSPDRFDAYPDSVAIRNNLIFIALISGFSFTCWYFFYPERVAAPRSYPYGGLYKALGGSEEDKEVYQARVDEGN
ncbi:NIAM subunit of mitochondrial NADH:ubiquinone oxidoreductase (complex I), putative [Geotrichum candidum]|uniref:NIAM subunit of mitochondrial NADH:ubiquinone oxidoreductase (Complex I), putative n=1 Tax=Geotrichum candidum TaxID=1173061 RepID=A0A0J9X5E5_GEOCN|nr:NIAM subunit of mitochondrial NADH:ubiquinone oxidoreductase (complex I), putative [Geotrichum candidum]